MLSSYVFVGNLHSYYKALPTEAFKIKLFLKPSLKTSKPHQSSSARYDSHREKGFIYRCWVIFVTVGKTFIFIEEERSNSKVWPICTWLWLTHWKKVLIFTEIKSNIIFVFTTSCILSSLGSVLNCSALCPGGGLAGVGATRLPCTVPCTTAEWLQWEGFYSLPCDQAWSKLPLDFSMGAWTMNLNQCKRKWNSFKIALQFPFHISQLTNNGKLPIWKGGTLIYFEYLRALLLLVLLLLNLLLWFLLTQWPFPKMTLIPLIVIKKKKKSNI